MVPAASSGTGQRLTLDHPSFEKLLAAAWVLQCLHDQMHPEPDGGDVVVQPAISLAHKETASSVPQQTINFDIPATEGLKPEISHPEICEPEITRQAIQLSSSGVEVSQLDASSAHSPDEATAELVKTQEAIESGIQGLDATVKRLVSLSPNLAAELAAHAATLGAPMRIEPVPVEPTSCEPKVVEPKALELKLNRPVPVADAPAVKLSPIWQKAPDKQQPASGPPSFNVRIALNWFRAAVSAGALSFRANSKVQALHRVVVATPTHVYTNFNRLRDAVTRGRPAFRPRTDKRPDPHASLNPQNALKGIGRSVVQRTSKLRVNFSLRSLRAVAIATPVWLLAVVANLLLLETWLHQPFQGGQAMSATSPSTAEAAVTVNPPLPTTSSQPSSRPAKEIARSESHRPAPVPLLATHEQITDPGTQSAVEELSRFELNGLRRQAKYGDDSAAFTLGMAYETGHYIRQNCAEAARWVRMAAEAGNSAAQYNLGLRYRDGDGVTADLHESEKWLRKAAAHRNREARMALQLLASR